MSTSKDNICITGKNATISVAGNDLGFTKGGVFMRVNNEYYDVFMDQNLVLLKKQLIERRCFVRTVVGEATLENLRIAWNLNSSALVSSSLEVDESENSELVVVFTGKGANNTTRTVTLHAAVLTTADEQAYVKAGETLVPIEFECVWDSDEGCYCNLVDAA